MAKASRGGAALPGQKGGGAGLFRRQGGLRDDFEREFKHQVMRSLDRNSKEDEKSLEKWTNELRAKAEAEEIKKMKQEDVRSRKLRSSGLKHLTNHEYVGQPPVNVVNWTVMKAVTPGAV